MNAFNLKFVSNGGTVYEGECYSLIIPTSEGFYGIQANHAPVIIAASEGKIKYKTPEGDCTEEIKDAVVRFQHNTANILSRN